MAEHKQLGVNIHGSLTCVRCRQARKLRKKYGACANCVSYFFERRSMANARGESLSFFDFLRKHPFQERRSKTKMQSKLALFPRVYNELIPGLVIHSSPMQQIGDMVRRLAATEVTVIITGESGVGKELVAHALHLLSERRENPFVVIDCTRFTESLIESEFFGHEKGSFTGATATKHGLFEAADGGTVFLDEISELPVQFQAKLLRVLETGMIRRIGSVNYKNVDVRTVAATNQDLVSLVSAKQFREDLYYRMGMCTISILPLRERRQDIPMLVEYFRTRVCPEVTFTDSAMRVMVEYDWPGNVRELKNVIVTAIALANGGLIDSLDLHHRLTRGSQSGDEKRIDLTVPISLSEVEQRVISAAVKRNDGNLTKAARELGIHRQAFYHKYKSFRIL